jgi:DNA invertase Pin-like site-specific DNA recombinase
MTAFIAYFRVSTDRQGKSGLGLDAQREAVRGYVAGHGSIIEEFTEVESGKKNERPQLALALAACRRHRAVLIIARLDRLARNLAFIANLMESGVDFVAVDVPHANRLTVHILAAVAEDEGRRISIRTRDALAAAKKRGIRLGNPNPRPALALAYEASRAAANRYASTVRPLIERLQGQNLSLRKIATELNERNVQTPRGGKWHAQQVANVLQRAVDR